MRFFSLYELCASSSAKQLKISRINALVNWENEENFKNITNYVLQEIYLFNIYCKPFTLFLGSSMANADS